MSTKKARLLVLSALLILSLTSMVRVTAAQNTIAGTIYDKAVTPLADIEVELLDEYYRMRARTRTPSTGRYEFGGLNDGRWYVRVYAFRYDLVDETHEVVATSVSAIPGRQGVSYNIEDFYLAPKRGGIRDAGGLVFVQEVPREAAQAYKRAIDDLDRKKADEGFAGLQKAIEIFPKYYLALFRLGAELRLRRQWLLAAQAYLQAAEVNPKGAEPFYYAALSLSQLGKDYLKAALTSARAALNASPNSAAANLLAGTIERQVGKLELAEKHLVQAKKLSPNKSPEIFKELAQLYGDEKKFAQAADELENYIKAAKLSEEEEAKAKKVVESLRAKAASRN